MYYKCLACSVQCLVCSMKCTGAGSGACVVSSVQLDGQCVVCSVQCDACHM